MITIISSYAFPANNATANRVRFMANAIQKNNVDVYIQVISSPSDNTSNNDVKEKIYIDSIKIKKSKNLIIRAIKELVFSLKVSALISKKSSFQVYTVPSPIILVSAYFRRSNNFGIDVRDCSWDYMEGRGLLGFIASKLLIFILRPIFKRAAFISCTNSFEAASISKNFKRKATVIPNGIEEKKYQKLILISSTMNATQDSTRIVYAGNLGYAQSLMTLVDSVKTSNNFNVELIGEGAQKSYINKYIADNHVDNVRVISSMGWNDLVDKYVEAEILYAQITKDFASAIPTKIFEYIATGKKVVLGLPNGPAKSIFSSFSGVFFHEPLDVDSCICALNAAKNSVKPDRNLNNLLLKDYVREKHQGVFCALLSK